MSDNEAPVEVIQGEARAREVLAAEYERDGHEAFAAEVRSGNLNRTGMGTAIRAMLAYQSEAPAQGMSGDLHAILAGAHKVATGQVNDNGYEIKQRLDTVHRILEQALSLPLADREAIAREVFRRTGCSEKCAGDAADAILALSGSLPPSPVGEGAKAEVPEFFFPLSDDHPSKLEGEHVWLWHRLWDHARLGWYDNEAQWWKIGFPDGEWWGVGIPPSHVARVTPREYLNREREVTLAPPTPPTPAPVRGE